MIVRFLFIAGLLLLSQPSQAEEGRYALVCGEMVEGVWVIDIDATPAKEGCRWVDDAGGNASPGYKWDGTEFVAPPPPPLTPEQEANEAREARDQDLKALGDVQAMVDRLKNATPAQIDTWVDNNMNNLAQARTVMKALLKVLAYSLRP